MAAVRAHQLVKVYRNGAQVLRVLDGVDLQIDEGEHIALIGRSGSGKSTLLNLLGGIDVPDAGEIAIGEQVMSAMSERRRTLLRRRRIGFVYQAFNLIPTLTIGENVALPLELNDLNPSTAAEQARQILEQVDLADRLGAFPDQLSGGEQQRVAIARALVHQPDLILADEPTGNLDAQTGRQVLDLLHGLSAKRRPGLLVVTHSRAVADRAHRIIALDAGRICTAPDTLAW
jgi:putative ABC transport system ATP-binding protein